MALLLVLFGGLSLILSFTFTLRARAQQSPAKVRMILAWGKRDPFIVLRELRWKLVPPLAFFWLGLALLVSAIFTGLQ